MSFKPFEVTAAHLIYVGLGFFIVIFGMLSLFIKEKLYLGEAPLAIIFGIIVGPAALNLFNPISWGDGASTRAPGGHVTNEITLEIMRVCIALSVFAVGVELPKKYLLRHWKSIAMLLGPVMIWGWIITAAFILALVPGMDFLNSLVIAACVTPTDPILAQAVVGGPWAEKHVPAHLRHMLQCESGCNDGAAFPFLYLALFLTKTRGNEGKGIAEWFYDALAYQIIFGTLLGALIGWAARKAMRFSERHRLVDRESFVAQYVSLAIASMGVNVLLGSDDLLAAFACGTAFAWDGWFTKQTEDSNFSNIIDLLFNVATFIYIGALMPWYEFAHAASGALNLWRCFVLAIAVLLLKRIPIILALWRWIPDIKTFREALFSGHFGPMGVGAIFIATLGRHELPEEIPDPPETSNDVLALTIQPIVFFLVLCSIAVHGLTVPFFAFSKRATTITRTWSRNPSFADGGEPGWMNRMRRFATGETMQSAKDPESGDGMTEIQRVLNAQLGVIGKGAIGGDYEKELRGESPNGRGSADDSSGSKTRIGLLNTRTEKDLELAEGEMNEKAYDSPQQGSSYSADKPALKRCDYDDLDDWNQDEVEDPSCEWGGDDTAEMRIYKAKLAEKKEARRRQREQNEAEDDGDMGEAPMDRELISGRIRESDEDEEVRKDREGHFPHHKEILSPKDQEERNSVDKIRQEEEEFPKARAWVEGSSLVIEYLESRSSEPDVHVVHLTPEEVEKIASSSQDEHHTVPSSWMESHRDQLDNDLGDHPHREWHPAESVRKLVATGALQSWLHSSKRQESRSRDTKTDVAQGKRDESHDETEQERTDRATMMFEAMNWRKGNESDGEDSHKLGRRSMSHAHEEAIDTSSSRSVSPSGPAMASQRLINRSKSPPMLGGRRGSNDLNPSRQPHPRQHLATGGRRASMRRRILAGKAYLGGNEAASDAGGGVDESAGEFVDVESSSQDSKFEMKESPSTGLLRSPDEYKAERAGNRTPSASVSFLDTGDSKHDRVDGTPCGPSRRTGSTRRRRMGLREGPQGKPRSTAPQEERSTKNQSSGSDSRSGPLSPPTEGPTRLTLTTPDEEKDDPIEATNATDETRSFSSGRNFGSKGSSSKAKKPPGRLSAFLTSLTTSSSSAPTTPKVQREENDALAPSERSQVSEGTTPVSASGGIQAFQLPPSSAASENPEVIAALQSLNGGRGSVGTNDVPVQPSTSGSGTPASSRSGTATPGPRTRTHLEAGQGRSEGILTSSSFNTPERGLSRSATPNNNNDSSVAFDLPTTSSSSRD